MDNIQVLKRALMTVIQNQVHLEVGIVSGDQVLVGGALYNPSWSADIDKIDGKEIYCVISQGRCVVVGER